MINLYFLNNGIQQSLTLKDKLKLLKTIEEDPENIEKEVKTFYNLLVKGTPSSDLPLTPEALDKLKIIASEYSLPLHKITFKIRNGSVHQEILEEAKKIDADAIVMMATKPGLSSYFISSTAERVIRHAKCSVFIIRLNDNN